MYKKINKIYKCDFQYKWVVMPVLCNNSLGNLHSMSRSTEASASPTMFSDLQVILHPLSREETFTSLSSDIWPERSCCGCELQQCQCHFYLKPSCNSTPPYLQNSYSLIVHNSLLHAIPKKKYLSLIKMQSLATPLKWLSFSVGVT